MRCERLTVPPAFPLSPFASPAAADWHRPPRLRGGSACAGPSIGTGTQGGSRGREREGGKRSRPPAQPSRAEPAGEREADTHPAAALPAHATPADTYQPYSPPPRVRDNGLTRSPRPRLAPPGPAPGRVGGRIKRGGARFWRALAAGPTCGPGRGREELPTSNSRKWPKQKEKNSDSRDRMMKDCSHPRGPLIHEEHVVFQRPVQTPRQAVMT